MSNLPVTRSSKRDTKIWVPPLRIHGGTEENIEFFDETQLSSDHEIFTTRSVGLAAWLYMYGFRFIQPAQPFDSEEFRFPYTMDEVEKMQQLINEYVTSQTHQHDVLVVKLKPMVRSRFTRPA